jgi:hypothetical protein
MNVLYLTVLKRCPNRANPPDRKDPGCESILDALAITSGDRINIR